jgi:ParB family transcriptional regulator, chromosome partitioning protein
MRRPGGLGKGLEALIPNTPRGDGERSHPDPALSNALAARRERLLGARGLGYHEIPIQLIDANPRQPRREFEEGELTELAASIAAVGVLQPVVVRPVGNRFQLVMGERRIRAASLAGLEIVPAVVRETAEENLLRDALIENIHRQGLNPLEEAAAYEELLSDFDVTHDDLASRLGKSRPTITNALRLLSLPVAVQRRVAAGTLSAGHARAVASVPDAEQQELLADRIIKEGMTVRQAEELARRVRLDGRISPAREETGRGRRTRVLAPGVSDLAERLSDRLETRVRVELGQRKGKVLIEFASLDDLQRICDAIGLRSEGLAEAPDRTAGGLAAMHDGQAKPRVELPA